MNEEINYPKDNNSRLDYIEAKLIDLENKTNILSKRITHMWEKIEKGGK